MALYDAVKAVRDNDNVAVKRIDNYQNVQFVTDAGVTISIGYGSHHYSNAREHGPNWDRVTTVEVYIWRADGRIVKTRKLRMMGQSSDGILGYFPTSDVPSLVAHVARYIR